MHRATLPGTVPPILWLGHVSLRSPDLVSHMKPKSKATPKLPLELCTRRGFRKVCGIAGVRTRSWTSGARAGRGNHPGSGRGRPASTLPGPTSCFPGHNGKLSFPSHVTDSLPGAQYLQPTPALGLMSA